MVVGLIVAGIVIVVMLVVSGEANIQSTKRGLQKDLKTFSEHELHIMQSELMKMDDQEASIKLVQAELKRRARHLAKGPQTGQTFDEWSIESFKVLSNEELKSIRMKCFMKMYDMPPHVQDALIDETQRRGI